MPGADGCHRCEPSSAREAESYARPLLPPCKRGEDCQPFIFIVQDESWMSAATGCCCDSIAIQKTLAITISLNVRAHRFKMNLPVGNQFVKVLHHHRFSKHRKLMQRTICQPVMEFLIEWGIRVGVVALAAKRLLLISCDLRA